VSDVGHCSIGFGKRHSKNYDTSLKCSVCGESKSNEELNADGYRYVCNSCLENKGDDK